MSRTPEAPPPPYELTCGQPDETGASPPLPTPSQSASSGAEQRAFTRKSSTREGHIQDLIASKVFGGCSTNEVKEDLGIHVDKTGNRILILSVFRKLMPITDLEGEEFIRAWWDCVLCHRVLMGVLNDFDLSTPASSDGEERPTGTNRTGTLPFMARDLLEPEALQGQVKHLYRHDFESFLWVLTWVAHRYQGGKEIHAPPFDDWLIDFGCLQSKNSFLVHSMSRKKVPPATSSYENVWMHFGKVLARAIFQHEMADEESISEWEVDRYFNLMKQALDASPSDLRLNPLLQAGLGEHDGC